jgi:hypothetical protein
MFLGHCNPKAEFKGGKDASGRTQDLYGSRDSERDLAIQEARAHVCEEILESGIDVAHLQVPGDGPIRIHH